MSHQPTVRFGEIEIHSFLPTLGDHPCCRSGAPIALSDTRVGFQTMPIDEYEPQREAQRRPNAEGLYLDRSERRSTLLQLRFSRVQLYRAEREVSKAQASRAQSILDAQ